MYTVACANRNSRISLRIIIKSKRSNCTRVENVLFVRTKKIISYYHFNNRDISENNFSIFQQNCSCNRTVYKLRYQCHHLLLLYYYSLSVGVANGFPHIIQFKQKIKILNIFSYVLSVLFRRLIIKIPPY
jgi:hypothetical protein